MALTGSRSAGRYRNGVSQEKTARQEIIGPRELAPEQGELCVAASEPPRDLLERPSSDAIMHAERAQSSLFCECEKIDPDSLRPVCRRFRELFKGLPASVKVTVARLLAHYHNLGRLPEPEITPQILLRRHFRRAMTGGASPVVRKKQVVMMGGIPVAGSKSRSAAPVVLKPVPEHGFSSSWSA